jgi:putative FmdB family regulatory protein
MPIYEYECERTGRRFEVFQKMSDDPIMQCPECGGKTRRLIGTGTAVIVQGNGYQAMDHQNTHAEEPVCGRSQPCCGREVPCDTRPCDK